MDSFHDVLMGWLDIVSLSSITSKGFIITNKEPSWG